MLLLLPPVPVPPPLPTTWWTNDDLIKLAGGGAPLRGGFSVNEDVGDVERVQEDRLEHRSRRRNAACRSDWRDTARATPLERFTAIHGEQGFLRMAAPLSLGGLS